VKRFSTGSIHWAGSRIRKMTRACGRIAVLGFLMALTGPFGAGSPAMAEVARYQQTLDVIDAVYLPALKKVVYVDHLGAVGGIQVDGTTATASILSRTENEDFTCLLKLDASNVLIGSSRGKLYKFDGEKVMEVTELSEYQEPLLSLSVSDGTYWATGARGLIARSSDAKDWSIVEIDQVVQPSLALPVGETGTLFFGVANIVSETVQISGTVNGKPAVPDQDYRFFPDEGMIEIANPFDENSAPAIAFSFRPGPPFRPGDVSWNVVLQEGGRLTLAGEFGLIFQSVDGAQSWVRRNGRISKTEASQSYWISGDADDSQIILGGAAGLVGTSDDGGATWRQLPRPGNEGVFGVRLQGDKIFIAGAVGLVGEYNGAGKAADQEPWNLVDRSATNLYSWLKTFVEIDDGGLLLFGGTSTALAYDGDGWKRIQLTLGQE
jgi:hypothetical protein